MSEIKVFTAEPRQAIGTGGARAMRRAGRVPAIVYGDSKPPMAVALDPRPLGQELTRTGFFARLLDLDIKGEKVRVLCRDVQYDPVRDTPIHADFMRVSPTSRITVDVPVRFDNREQSPGLKVGGVLNIVRHAVEVSCRADAIPAEIVIDVSGSEIGHSFHISAVTLPEGVRPTIRDRDFTIATIAAPTTAPVEEEKPAEAAVEGAEVEAAPAEGEEKAAEAEEKD